MKRLFGPLIIGLACMIFAGGVPAAEPQAAPQPSAFVPQPRYEFAPVIDGQSVAHDFIIQNKGNAPLIIERVKTD
jgi:hypothetical protein